MSMFLYRETAQTFDGNGLGGLAEAFDAEVYRELTTDTIGQYELKFRYPVTGLRYAQLATGRIVTARPDPVKAHQPFRIYRVTRPMAGSVTVYARHWALFDLEGVVALPFVAAGAGEALAAMQAAAVGGCPFVFSSDIESTRALGCAVPTDFLTLMGGGEGMALRQFGGEYEFDGNAVRLLKRRGADRGFSIRYGKNLLDLQQEENIANMYTGIVPYWSDWMTTVTVPGGYVSGPGSYPRQRLKPVDFSDRITAELAELMLQTYAEDYVAQNGIGVPEVSWTVNFVQLEQFGEYSNPTREPVQLGDTVSVIFPELGVDASARVTATRYDPILERYIDVNLGTLKPNPGRTMARTRKMAENAGRCVTNADGITTVHGSDIRMARLNGKTLSWKDGGDGYHYLAAPGD